MSKISDLKSALGAGLRTTKFQVQLTLPVGITAFGNGSGIINSEGNTVYADTVDANRLSLLCKSASFPQKTIGMTEVWIDGKKGLLQGDTEFEQSWELTFYETERHAIRQNFLAWQEQIDAVEGVDHDESSLGGTAIIEQLDGKGKVVASYKFHNVWPQVVAAVEMSVDSVNAIGEFSVTMAFDFWTTLSTNELGDIDTSSATLI